MMEKGRSKTAPRATARVKVHSSSLGGEEVRPTQSSVLLPWKSVPRKGTYGFQSCSNWKELSSWALPPAFFPSPCLHGSLGTRDGHLITCHVTSNARNANKTRGVAPPLCSELSSLELAFLCMDKSSTTASSPALQEGIITEEKGKLNPSLTGKACSRTSPAGIKFAKGEYCFQVCQSRGGISIFLCVCC